MIKRNLIISLPSYLGIFTVFPGNYLEKDAAKFSMKNRKNTLYRHRFGKVGAMKTSNVMVVDLYLKYESAKWCVNPNFE